MLRLARVTRTEKKMSDTDKKSNEAACSLARVSRSIPEMPNAADSSSVLLGGREAVDPQEAGAWCSALALEGRKRGMSETTIKQIARYCIAIGRGPRLVPIESVVSEERTERSGPSNDEIRNDRKDEA